MQRVHVQDMAFQVQHRRRHLRKAVHFVELDIYAVHVVARFPGELENFLCLPRERVEQSLHAAHQAGRGPAALDRCQAAVHHFVESIVRQRADQNVALPEHYLVGTLEAFHVAHVVALVLLQSGKQYFCKITILPGELGHLLQFAARAGQLGGYALQGSLEHVADFPGDGRAQDLLLRRDDFLGEQVLERFDAASRQKVGVAANA